MLTRHLLLGDWFVPSGRGRTLVFGAEALRGRSHMCKSLFGNTGLALSAQCLEKSSATEVQLSTRASASTLCSVKVSVGLTPLASQQGSSDMATSNWRLYHGLLRRGDVSRGSSTESAKVTLLQGGDASEASARASLPQSMQGRIDPALEEESLNSARRC